MKTQEEALRETVEAHIHPRGGSPYWLDRRSELQQIETVDDLASLGPMDRSALESRPLADFVPRSLWSQQLTTLILGETGGTTGRPVRTVFKPGEFKDAFARPFALAACLRTFPRRGRWLFVGPSGPHIIGQAARRLARIQDSLEPFSVDLDPRWARNQDGLNAALYEQHVLGQALDIFQREAPDVLFSTPPLLELLADELHRSARDGIRGIHVGGMPVSGEALISLRGSFPNAVILPGYGNSMLGMFPELIPHDSGAVDYFALAGRLVVQVVAESDGVVQLLEPCAPGERGRVVVHRLDESCFLPNLVERDRATVVETPTSLQQFGFQGIGLRNPEPVASIVDSSVVGIY